MIISYFISNSITLSPEAWAARRVYYKMAFLSKTKSIIEDILF